MSDDAHPEDASDIPVLELPPGGFVSRIPEHLLVGKSDSEKWILLEASKMSHFAEWAGKALVATHSEVRKTNGKVRSLEAFKAMFYSVWGFAGAVLAIIGGLAGLVAILQFLASLLGPK